MRKYFIPFFLVIALSLTFPFCTRDEQPSDLKENPQIVTQFIYDGMSLYYLWAEYMLDKKPTQQQNDPKKYFESILYPIDLQHGWSWITDDVEGLLADFSGESNNAFGFSPYVLWADETRTNLVAIIRYVFPNTPASEAGLQRGNIITQINGEKTTISNYQTLYGSNVPVTFKVFDQFFENPRNISITPRKINTDPVLYTHVYHYPEQGKKIAYLFYTEFISNYNQSLFNAFAKFNREGVTDLIIDLRYNPGGDISAATYLGSLIAPRQEVENKSIFTILSYNPLINLFFDEEGISRSDSLGVYRKNIEHNPLDANLNLNNVYIIATNSTYSASELTTFCLRPYMNVVHIGDSTGGKYTASWTVHAYNTFPDENGYNRAMPVYDEKELSEEEKLALKNWAMQPIVAKYTDKNGNDFIDQGCLIPNYPVASQEEMPATWVAIGDSTDYLLSKAIYLITGQSISRSTILSKNIPEIKMRDAHLYSPQEEKIKESVNLDNIPLTPVDIEKLKEMRK
jgi:hypothetical protein